MPTYFLYIYLEERHKKQGASSSTVSAEAVAYQPYNEPTTSLGTAAAGSIIATPQPVPAPEPARHAANDHRNRRRTELQPPEEPLTSESFSEFYGRLREPIERYVRYLFNLDPYDAEDVAAGSFENALRALPPGRIVQQPTDWMYQIARRKAIDFMRHRRAIPMQSLSAPTGDGIPLADTMLGPDDDDSYAQMVDRRNVLAHIFKHLQPNYATAIRLYDHEGYSYQEIMRIMNVGYSNAKNIVSRGREQARLLAAEYLSGETLVRRRVRLSVD